MAEGQNAAGQVSRRGLMQAGAVVAGALAVGAMVAGDAAVAAAADGPTSATRETVTLAGAQALIAAAMAKAQEIAVPMAIVIVDESGVMKAFARMDGNGLASVDIVQQKAYTAAAFRAPTHVLAQRNGTDPIRLASFTNLPRVTFLGGGYPISKNNVVIGGIGVGGGTPEQDMQVAEAALATFS